MPRRFDLQLTGNRGTAGRRPIPSPEATLVPRTYHRYARGRSAFLTLGLAVPDGTTIPDQSSGSLRSRSHWQSGCSPSPRHSWPRSYRRGPERLLVVLTVVLVVLAGASGILLAVGAAIDRWDLTELASWPAASWRPPPGPSEPSGFRADSPAFVPSRQRGPDCATSSTRSLAAHAEQLGRELDTTLARERAETSHRSRAGTPASRGGARRALAGGADIARAELSQLRRRGPAPARAAAFGLERQTSSVPSSSSRSAWRS